MSGRESESECDYNEVDNSAETTRTAPPKRKKRRTLQKFRAEYAVKFPVVRKSTVSDTHAYCVICNSDFSIGHGGIGDVAKHVGSAKHVAKVGSNAPLLKIEHFFADTKDLSVMRAEALFTEFIIEHNIPIACADHAGPLFKKMFPDSSIATKYGCARTKTTCVIETLANNDAKRIASAVQTGPFALATDGSNDLGAAKLYPICVRYFDNEMGKVMCVMLSLKECRTSSTGENIFSLLDAELSSFGIPWQNCVCFAADNASVMMGKTKGVAAFLLKKAPSLYILGCACHLIHLAAAKAASALTVKVDELLVDVYYYLDKSSN